MREQALDKLARALRKGELPDAAAWDVGQAVQALADALAQPAGGPTADEVRAALRILNRRRHFDHTRLLGQAWRDCRGFDATVVKHQAQALIELAALDAAEDLLRDGLPRVRAAGASAQDRDQISEYEGLLGRIFKQRFVATGNRDALVQATDQYLAQYERDPDRLYWHGINAVALRAREAREGVRPADAVPAETLAATLYKQALRLYRKNSGDHWLPATLSEASLALDKCDQAELWLYRFVHHPNVQPFDIRSYARQLREIWQGGDFAGPAGTCADRLAAIMTLHIARTQSTWTVPSSAVQATAEALAKDPTAFEKNFSGESSFSLEMIKRMLAACASIGCVCNKAGERLGTGFLVSGTAFRPTFDAGPVFVTNAHVVSETVAGAIASQDARVTFEVESAAKDAPVFYRISEVLFSSGPGDLGTRNAAGDDLDITIVRLDALPASFAALKTTATLPLVEPKAKAYLVGHPRGSGLQISLHDSLLLDIDDDERLVHYRTPTDPGSSGSPVFNARWEVFAIHHGGSSAVPRLHGEGKYEANEGIALSAVERRLSRA
jgi:hypothetical protein